MHHLIVFISENYNHGDYDTWIDLARYHYCNIVLNHVHPQNITFIDISDKPANIAKIHSIEMFTAYLTSKVDA